MGLHRGASVTAHADRLRQREARQPKTHYGYERSLTGTTACGIAIRGRSPFANPLSLSLREGEVDCDRCQRARFL